MAILDPDELRLHVDTELARWNAPGAELAAVRDGEVLLAEGFGRRDLDGDLPAGEITLFDHGSVCKAFTAVLAAVLVDEGLLEWDRPVRDQWPGFRLHDPVATERVTISDLLAHRSGLARHEWAWLANPSWSRAELIRRLRHLEPAHDLRAAWEYGNLGYAAAGALIGEVTGSTWEQQMRARVLEPLGMTRTDPSGEVPPPDRARPYTERGGTPVPVDLRPMEATAPAGRLWSCARDIARWLVFQLGDGRFEGRRLLAEATLAETHRVHMAVEQNAEETGMRFAGYALGWVTGFWHGRPMLWHSGGVDGFRTEILLLPEDGIGLAASVNHGHTSLLPAALNNHLADLLLGRDPRPWSAYLHEDWRRERAGRPPESVRAAPDTGCSHPLTDFTGVYEHPGYGELTVGLNGEGGLTVRLGELPLAARWRHFDTWTVGYDHPEAALETTWPLTFVTGARGDVAEAVLPLEESLAPLRFRRSDAPAPAAGPDALDAVRWRRRLSALLRRADAPGAVLAIMHGDRLLECAAGLADLRTGVPMTSGTRFPIASITKSYTATLVMQLVDEGLLDLDRPIRSYIPDFRVADREATERLTARHLLTHTGGIDGDKDDSGGRGDDALERYVASCATLGQIHDVGATFSYCNSGYSILGRLVEVLRGRSWDQALRDHLLDPIGADETATLPEDLIWSPLATGHQKGDDGLLHTFPTWENERSLGPAGGVVTTTADLMRFVRTHIDRGMTPGGIRVLSEESATAMLTRYVRLPNPYEGITHWGLGWAFRDHGGPLTLVGHDGDLLVHHARLAFCPEERFAVALLTNGDGIDQIAGPLFREALSIIGVSPSAPVGRPAAPPDADPALVAGTYATVAVQATFTPAPGHLNATFRIISPQIATLLPESQRERQVSFHPVTTSLYLGRLDDDEAPVPAVFYEADGHRYVHIGLRAMRAVETAGE